jgi:hypothetical protein
MDTGADLSVKLCGQLYLFLGSRIVFVKIAR